jgi:hypothetical protein
MVVLVIAILLASGQGSAVASQISSVFVTNTADHPVPVNGTVTVAAPTTSPLPVQETNTDANGAIKVHEQGTANVNVTNSSLTVAAPTPVTGGGDAASLPASAGSATDVGSQTATALTIHMGAGVEQIAFETAGGGISAAFSGPGLGGNSDILLSLPRPISFSRILCNGASDSCAVGWVGNSTGS